jgi:L-amino acid N-acyltransferase YncA
LKRFSEREGYGRTAEVSVYLLPEYRGMGLGGRAVVFLEEVARSNGFHALIASICAENTGSIRMFERNGYTKCAHLKEVGFKFERLLDVVDYEKILD